MSGTIANDYRGQMPESNFYYGRAQHSLTGLVGHHTACHEGAAVQRFTTPGTQVSAHELYRRDGGIDLFLDEANTAFADGLMEANLDTFAAEFEQDPSEPDFTDAQYETGHRRFSEVAAAHGFALNADTLKPHSFYVATACPGPLDLGRLIAGGGAAVPFVAQTVTPTPPGVRGVVYDTPTNDRSFLDYNTVAYVPDQIAGIGVNTDWTEAKTAVDPATGAVKWLLHLANTTWALWDDCVDDSDATHDAAHSSPPDFAPAPVVAPVTPVIVPPADQLPPFVPDVPRVSNPAGDPNDPAEDHNADVLGG